MGVSHVCILGYDSATVNSSFKKNAPPLQEKDQSGRNLPAKLQRVNATCNARTLKCVQTLQSLPPPSMQRQSNASTTGDVVTQALVRVGSKSLQPCLSPDGLDETPDEVTLAHEDDGRKNIAVGT